MLPSGHIEYTWAVLNLLQKVGLCEDADYRLVALSAVAPDLLDKPLALTLYRQTDAALFWGHNIWLHGAVWLMVGAACVFRARRSSFRSSSPRTSGLKTALPYLLAFSGHLVADRMWGFRDSLLYPLGGGHWHPWVHVGEPAAMLAAYLDIIRTTPLLVFFEISGLALLAWLVFDRGLWGRRRWVQFLQTGRLPEQRHPSVPMDRDERLSSATGLRPR
jgi:hypothetical protein